MSHDFQNEIAWLGAQSSPAFVRAPEGNGCAERFIRTLKACRVKLHSLSGPHAFASANAALTRNANTRVRSDATYSQENLLWLSAFETIEDLCQALLRFRKTYNENWLIGRHGHRSPAQFRRGQMDKTQMVA